MTTQKEKLVKANQMPMRIKSMASRLRHDKSSKWSYVWLIRDEHRFPVSVCKSEVNARKQLYELARYVADGRNWKIKNVNDTTIHFCNRDGSYNAEWIDMIELPLRNTVATFKKSMGLLDEYDWEKEINN